jgi:hypothetical protein
MTYQPPANDWRTFLIVWTTQSISMFGSALTVFAIHIWLAQTRTMLVIDTANGILSLLLAALMATGLLRLWSLLIFGVLFAILSAFHKSARSAS